MIFVIWDVDAFVFFGLMLGERRRGMLGVVDGFVVVVVDGFEALPLVVVSHY